MDDSGRSDTARRPVDRRQRLLARCALLALAAIVAIIVATGAVHSLAALVVGLIGIALLPGAVWMFLAHRGWRRWLAVVALIAVPIAVIIAYIVTGLLLEVIACVALAALVWWAAHRAGQPSSEAIQPETRPAVPPRRAYLIMNPRSGGGKVVRFKLAEKATELGAYVELLPATGHADVTELAEHAVDNGADLLGVAGGDGTQALVAAVAARRGVPMLVISAGTRNHFAMDLGLDREDPSHCLDALHDGVEMRIDLGFVGDRPFVNNASFGAYAEMVRSPAYRDDKAGTALRTLPDLISGHSGPRLEVRDGGHTVLSAPQAVLVSNNPYEGGDIAGLSRRARLDQGVLGVIGVKVDSQAQAAALLTRHGQSRSLARLTAREVVIDADAPSIAVGIDGESVLLPTPVRCEIRALALRVVVPRDRPGVHVPAERVPWRVLVREAVGLRDSGTAGDAAGDPARA